MTQQIQTTKYIPVSYETDDVKVSFKVEFGKGQDAANCYNSTFRTHYDTAYDIQNHKTDDDINMYCLLAEEGVIVMKVSDVEVISKTSNNKRKIINGYMQYNYGITSVLDMNNEPMYDSPTSFMPSNDIERDGKPWIVHNNKTLIVDQNGQAQFQWSTAKALDKGIKPTPEQELMGVEERHENSGMLYITFQPMYTETEVIEEQEELTCGLSRGVSRGLSRVLTRRFEPESHAARVGYGSKAETKSKSSSAIAVPNSRFILPIRTRVIGDSFDPNIKCAKDLKSAMRVEDLQKKTGVLPDW